MTLCDLQWPLRETSSNEKFAYSKCYHSYKVLIRSDFIQKSDLLWPSLTSDFIIHGMKIQLFIMLAVINECA